MVKFIKLTSKTISGTTYNVEVKSDISGTNLNYHHYTCGNSTDTSCANVSYVYQIVNNSGTYRVCYLTLTTGVKVEEAINQMFTNNNVTSSTIKTHIDTWYSDSTKGNMTGYTQYLEDTPYCNDKSIYNLAGWNSDGDGSVGSPFIIE